jgi:hypothetical protein
MPAGDIDSLKRCLQRVGHWTDQEEELKPVIVQKVDAVDNEACRKFRLISEFARNTSNMLEHLVDKLMPRDLDAMSADGQHD